MILSEERQSHLAHVLVDGIWKDDLVDYADEDQAIRVAKKAIVRFVQSCEEIDKKVTAKIASLKRGVVEGSNEWDILYTKYYEEEMLKSGDK